MPLFEEKCLKKTAFIHASLFKKGRSPYVMVLVDSSPSLKTEKTKLYDSRKARLVHLIKWLRHHIMFSCKQLLDRALLAIIGRKRGAQ